MGRWRWLPCWAHRGGGLSLCSRHASVFVLLLDLFSHLTHCHLVPAAHPHHSPAPPPLPCLLCPTSWTHHSDLRWCPNMLDTYPQDTGRPTPTCPFTPTPTVDLVGHTPHTHHTAAHTAHLPLRALPYGWFVHGRWLPTTYPACHCTAFTTPWQFFPLLFCWTPCQTLAHTCPPSCGRSAHSATCRPHHPHPSPTTLPLYPTHDIHCHHTHMPCLTCCPVTTHIPHPATQPVRLVVPVPLLPSNSQCDHPLLPGAYMPSHSSCYLV